MGERWVSGYIMVPADFSVTMSNTTEDLTKQLGRFNLLDEECVRVASDEQILEPLVSRGSSYLVGKDTIKTPMIRAWHPTGWVSFKNLGTNMFLVEFENFLDKVRVLEGRPWNLDGNLFSLADFDGGDATK